MKIRFKQDRQTILQVLKSSNMKRKLRALDRMNGVNDRDTIHVLLKVLEDESWVLREKAAMKITQFGSRVVGRLERLLARGYWYTRAAACLALGEIGSPRPVPAIVRLLLREDNPTVTKEAAAALVKIAHAEPESYAAALNSLGLSGTEHERIQKLTAAAGNILAAEPDNE